MSYILDALKKSEQARLNVDTPLQQLLLRSEDTRDAPRRIWPYVVGGVLALNAAALYAWWRMTTGDVAEQQARAASEAAPAQAASTPLPSALPVRGAPAADAANARDQPTPTPPAPYVPERAAASVPAPVSPPATEPAVAANKAARTASVVAMAPASPAVPSAPPVATETARASGSDSAALDLPEAIRRELPPLVVSGVMREAGSTGWVVVNERPLREGEEVAPGLKVEKILERGAQFSYKGHRFQR